MKFNVIIHFPTTEKAQKELAKKVADVHAQTVVEIVKSISCPIEEKGRLVEAIKSYIPK